MIKQQHTQTLAAARQTAHSKTLLKMRQVDVTPEVIEEGTRCSGTYCIVAEATKRTLKKMGFHPKAVFADLQMIRFSLPELGKRYLYFCPRLAQISLLKFDKGDKVEPFKFHLGTPAQVVDMFPTRKDPVMAKKYSDRAKRQRAAGDMVGSRRSQRVASAYKLGARRGRTGTKPAKLQRAGKGGTRRHIKINGTMPPQQSPLSSTDRQFGLRSFIGAFA